MEVAIFYIVAILVIFTLVAAIADLSLWWQARREAEDAQAREGKVS